MQRLHSVSLILALLILTSGCISETQPESNITEPPLPPPIPALPAEGDLVATDIITGMVPHSTYTNFAEPETFNLPDEYSFASTTDTDTISLTINDDYIYRYAFISYSGQSWQQVDLTGSLSTHYITGSASATIPISPGDFGLTSAGQTKTRNYIVTYTCDSSFYCHDGWQIWQFDATLEQKGLVSWWKLDGDADDSVGDNQGTVNGATTSTDCVLGSCYYFDGDDNMDFGNGASLSFGSGFTTAAWVKFESLDYTGGQGNLLTIISKPNPDLPSPNSEGFWMGYDNRDNRRVTWFQAGDSTDFGTNLPAVTPLLEENQWYHFVMTADGSLVRAYLNGTLLGEMAVSGLDLISGSNLVIGRRLDTFGLLGSIDEVMIWNRSLNPAEVSSLFSSFGYAPPACTDTCSSLGYQCGIQVVCGTSTNCGTCTTGTCNSTGQCETQDVEHADYYVATNGNDGNPGTIDRPFATFQRATSVVEAGDVVHIRGGTYHETLNPTISGTPTKYITYQNYDNELVTINAAYYGILVNGRQYLKFKGLHITNASNSGVYIYNTDASNIILDEIESYNNSHGILASGASGPIYNITINNSLVHNNEVHGIYLYSRVYDSIVSNNVVYSNEGTAAAYSHGIEISYDFSGSRVLGPKRITVIGNEVYDNEHQGIRTGHVMYVLIKDNYAHNNGATGIQLEDVSEYVVVEGNRCENNSQVYGFETGIWADSSTSVVVRDNYLADNLIGLMVTYSNRTILRNNIIVNNNRGIPDPHNSMGINIFANSHDISVVHNTLNNNSDVIGIKAGLGFCAFISTSSSELHLKNNIVSNTNSPIDFWIGCADYTSDNELFYAANPIAVNYLGSIMSLSQYVAASGNDAHSIEQNPLLTSNYHLQSGSPAIDSGAFLATTVGDGSGTTITLSDASYFTDGFNVVPGDNIMIGSNLVRITLVDYSTNTISINQSIQWVNGEKVSYPYNGLAPDIGAYES